MQWAEKGLTFFMVLKKSKSSISDHPPPIGESQPYFLLKQKISPRGTNYSDIFLWNCKLTVICIVNCQKAMETSKTNKTHRQKSPRVGENKMWWILGPPGRGDLRPPGGRKNKLAQPSPRKNPILRGYFHLLLRGVLPPLNLLLFVG